MKLSINILHEEKNCIVGQLLEFPEVISEGKNIRDLMSNLLDALDLIFEAKKEDFNKTLKRKGRVIEQEFVLSQ